MKTSWRHVLGLPLIAAAVLFSACATTQIINQWSDPSYTSPSFKRIMVIGVSKQDSIRRTFEDELVAQSKRSVSMPCRAICSFPKPDKSKNHA